MSTDRFTKDVTAEVLEVKDLPWSGHPSASAWFCRISDRDYDQFLKYVPSSTPNEYPFWVVVTGRARIPIGRSRFRIMDGTRTAKRIVQWSGLIDESEEQILYKPAPAATRDDELLAELRKQTALLEQLVALMSKNKE